MSRRKLTRWLTIVWIVGVSSALMITPMASAHMSKWFITPEEAAMAPAPEPDPLQGGEVCGGGSRGPRYWTGD